MRIRHKPWAIPELHACGYYIDDPKRHKNHWRELFPNQNPLHLEVGCGKGGFIAQLAFAHPEINYLAVDIKSEMLGLAKRNIEKRFGGRPNNLFLTAYNVEHLSEILGAADAVERLYINFCNPWPRSKHNKHRLTYTKQLFTYRSFLAPQAQIRFKTDDDALFLASKRYLIESGFRLDWVTDDLHAADCPENIVTEHERLFSEQGIKIKALYATAIPKKLIIFDLDGTLVDSVRDLAAAVNRALTENGFPSHPEERFYHFVGDGVYPLITRALPPSCAEDADTVERVKRAFDAIYRTDYAVYTKPYDGIYPLIQSLKNAGCKLAVLSNKPHPFSCEVVEHFFPNLFDAVLGASDRFEKKPDPSAVFYLLDRFHLQKTDAVLIGDSNIDIYTGKNAGIATVGAAWGFRGLVELRAAGADGIAQTPDAVSRLVL